MKNSIRAASVAIVVSFILAVSTLAGSASERPILVIGDSITFGKTIDTRYTRTVGDPMRAWYSFLSERMSIPVQISAQPGSGVLNKGYGVGRAGRCSGKTFGQRTNWNIQEYKPRIIIIEGGRNDLFKCNSKRQLVKTSTKELTYAYRSYMSHLKADAKSIGLSPKDVYVFSPWGTTSADQAVRVRGIERKYALANGFNWISMGFLTNAQAPDGGHPNADGIQYLLGQIEKNSDIMTKY